MPARTSYPAAQARRVQRAIRRASRRNVAARRAGALRAVRLSRTAPASTGPRPRTRRCSTTMQQGVLAKRALSLDLLDEERLGPLLRGVRRRRTARGTSSGTSTTRAIRGTTPRGAAHLGGDPLRHVYALLDETIGVPPRPPRRRRHRLRAAQPRHAGALRRHAAARPDPVATRPARIRLRPSRMDVPRRGCSG